MDESTARVTKPALRAAFEAIRSYAAHVATAGGCLAFYQKLLNGLQMCLAWRAYRAAYADLAACVSRP
jgi:hypothetical protein